MKLSASVIISVYNGADWLIRVIEALETQSRRDFEIIVADDGSCDEPRRRYRDFFRKHCSLPVKVVWHRDEGFLKTTILNAAIRNSSADYLIFLDGDCVPHPRFVADHLALARKGLVVAGRRIDLTPDISCRMEKEPYTVSSFASVRRMLLSELLHGRNVMRPLRRTFRLPLWLVGKIGKGAILGCNFSLYKEDFMLVDCFDERYRDPACGEDDDPGLRLKNAGIRIAKFPHQALVAHRCHDRLDFSSLRNREIFEEHRCSGAVKAGKGLSTHDDRQDTVEILSPGS